MDDHHLLAWYAKKMGQLLNGWPTAVHKCHRFGQQHLDIFNKPAPEDAVEFSFVKKNIEIPRNFVDDHKTGIMPGVLIAGTGISEADDQSQIHVWVFVQIISDKRKPIIKAGWMVCATAVNDHSCETGSPACR